MPFPLISTKVHIPLLPPGHLKRAALLAHLNEGLRVGVRLVLISAPAGYGKTTLVSEWVGGLSMKAVWFSIDEEDNEPLRFLDHLKHALHSLDDDVATDLSSITVSPVIPEAVAATLVSCLQRVRRAVIVLDDYHLVSSTIVQSIIEKLLLHMPKEVRLVVLTREDPPFPLARMRTRQQMIEIRARDLRFNNLEIKSLFKTLGFNLDNENIDILEKRTEGWVAGLQLVSLSLRNKTDGELKQFLRSFGGSHRYVIDYLMDEVFGRQNPDIQGFLCKTSILDTLCGPLCEAVTGIKDGAAVLRRLESENVFLVSMDDERLWYRYHCLFRDVLMTFIDPVCLPDLYRKAANWFETNGYRKEAVDYYIKAADWASGRKLICEQSAGLMICGEFNTLLRWLSAFPDEFISTDADLSTYRGWSLFLTGRIREAFEFVVSMDPSRFAGQSGFTVARVDALRLWFANISRSMPPEALASEAQKVLGSLDESDIYFRVGTLLPLGHAWLRTGDFQGAADVFREAYDLSIKTGQLFVGMTALANLAFTLNDMGMLSEAISVCESAIRRLIDNDGVPLPITDIALIPLGVFYYERGDVANAQALLLRGLDFCRRHFSDFIMGGDGELCLAAISMAQGRPSDAFEILKNLKDASSSSISGMEELIGVYEASFAMRCGYKSVAEAWGRRESLERESQSNRPYRGILTINYARFLNFIGEYRKSIYILEHLDKQGLLGQHARWKIAAAAVKAVAFSGLGMGEEAMDCLRPALAIGASQNYIRLFVDEGTELLKILSEPALTLGDSAIAQFVGRLIQTYGAYPTDIDKGGQPQIAGAQTLPEPLSDRELEILRLVSQGLSNREIAKTLFITEGTAKWHIHNILGKLGSNRRTKLVRMAKELGLV